MRLSHRALVGSAAFSILIGTFATSAFADGLGRLKISLELHGTTSWQGSTGGEWRKDKIDDFHSTEVVLKQGVTQNTNQWDPESAKRQQERVTRAQQRATELQAQAARAAANRPAGSNRPSGGVANTDMAQMMAMRDKIAACGADQACKQKLAMQMMSQGSGAAPAPAASGGPEMQAIMNMCVNEKHQAPGTKGFQECIETAGKEVEARMAPQAAAAGVPQNGKLVEAIEDDPEPDRYLPYWSHVDNFSCTFKGHTKIQRSYEGAEADVAGLLKFSGTEVGEGDADPKQICNYPILIIDTKTNTLWSPGFSAVGVPVTSTQKGGLLNGNTSTAVQAVYTGASFEAVVGGERLDGVLAWVFKTLSGAPLSGERVQEFTATTRVPSVSVGGKGTGKLAAKLTWSFTKE